MKKEVPFFPPAPDAKVATVALMRHGGSHLIRPIVAGLGFDIVEPGNFNAPIDQAFGPVIFFPRDPRNLVVSMARFNLWRKPAKRAFMIKRGTANDNMLAVLLDSEPFIPEMLRWAKIWATWPDALRIEYEVLTCEATALAAVNRISAFLGLDTDMAHDRALLNAYFERSPTFNGEHSRWQDWFGPHSRGIWKRDGGPELLSILGYET